MEGLRMGARIARFAGLAFFWALLTPGMAFAQAVVGAVAAIEEGARLERDGQRFRLAPEVSILSGDRILTNGTGTVQLQFRDGTRVAIGPNSEFLARDIRMRRGGRAQRFAVTSVGGTFRFLSGESARRAYEIATPAATMGIRGTEFDFAVEGGASTTLVTYDGEVEFCGAGDVCFAVSGSCAAVRAGRGGVDPNPVTGSAKSDLLARIFPFAQGQSRLGSSFQTRSLGCAPGDDDDPEFVPATVQAVEKSAPTQGPRGPASTDEDDDDDGGALENDGPSDDDAGSGGSGSVPPGGP
ncbi:MAG: FecR domain-containing protein [Pseudomonadota bacterium]